METVVIVNRASGCGHGGSTIAAIEAEFRAVGETPRVTCVNSDEVLNR